MSTKDGKLEWTEDFRDENTEYILSLSYGKDSMAMIEACRLLHWPVDRIVTVDIWATDTISADYPPMVEFKSLADTIIKERYGITVEHICLERKRELPSSVELEKVTYEKMFYRIPNRRQPVRNGVDWSGKCAGFPITASSGSWCVSLKTKAMSDFIRTRKKAFSDEHTAQGQHKEQKISIVQYLGIAADEPKRIERHSKKPNVRLPLVEIGWDEAYCRQWCEENGLLSPIYTTFTRGGCWFCHHQKVDALRELRKNYPEYWNILLKWDLDSHVFFKIKGKEGLTVHDFEQRFAFEDAGLLKPRDVKFRWKQVSEIAQAIKEAQ